MSFHRRHLPVCATGFLRVLHAQDQPMSFDPREVGPTLGSWQTLLSMFISAVLFYCFWKFLTWRTGREVPDRAVRFWLPTVIVAAALLVGFVESSGFFRDNTFVQSGLEMALLVLGMVNVPVIFVLGLVFGLLHFSQAWPVVAFGSVLAWWMWY